MNILSIHDGHNASASLMISGKIVLALQEERFNEIKNFTGYPYQSVKYCLNYLKAKNLYLDKAGISSVFQNPYGLKAKIFNNFKPNDFKEWWKTRINFNYFISKNGKQTKFINGKKRDIKTILYLKKIRNKYKNKFEYYDFKFLNNKNINKPNLEVACFKKERLDKLSQQTGLNKNKIFFIDHHTCHAYYGYFASGLNGQDCLISTIDGGGDGYKQTTWSVKKGKFKLLSRNNSCPLGKYWKIICVLLSLKPMEHEYKIMGLAPYSKEKYTNEVFNVFKNLCKINKFNIIEKKIPKTYKSLYEYLETKLSNHRFDAISGGIQKYSEHLVKKFINIALKRSNHKNFIGSGGLFMNVKLNKSISELKRVKNLFIPGSVGDESLSIGACYFLNKDLKNHTPENLYLGFQEEKLNLKKISNLYRVKKIKNSEPIVDELINGKIIGIFNKRAEFGARALGNRSIIARPDLKGTVKKINEAVKNRDFWMPFAVTILDKYHLKFIKNKKKIKSPHMTIGFDTYKKNSDKIFSGIHQYDETVRPQILEKKFNNKYYDLILRFYKRTKIPAVLNTSLNLHGKPLVHNLNQAIFTLKNSDLDCLVLNYEYMIFKKN